MRRGQIFWRSRGSREPCRWGEPIAREDEAQRAREDCEGACQSFRLCLHAAIKVLPMAKDTKTRFEGPKRDTGREWTMESRWRCLMVDVNVR